MCSHDKLFASDTLYFFGFEMPSMPLSDVNDYGQVSKNASSQTFSSVLCYKERPVVLM